jgi:transcriptional regulator NrdR family protein
VHTICGEAYILLSDANSKHINFDDLISFKIPVLSGIGASNTACIIEYLATNGPSLKYDVFKHLNFAHYPTVSRRIDDLRKRGYLAVSGKRLTERGKQNEESMYSLTWRGFVASLSSEKVRKDLINVLRKNPLLKLPEKEAIMVVLQEVTTSDELAVISGAIFEAYMKTIPNLEMINDSQLWVWLFAIREFPNLPKLSKMPNDVFELLDRPPILKVIKERVAPLVKQKADEMELVYRIFRAMGALSQFIEYLDENEKPSIQVKAYLENQLPKLFHDEKANADRYT